MPEPAQLPSLPPAESPPGSEPATPSFESALAELEGIVQRMEGGQLSLEDSLAAYQRGMELLKLCQTTLAAAEQKIQLLEGGELREFRVSEDAAS